MNRKINLQKSQDKEKEDLIKKLENQYINVNSLIPEKVIFRGKTTVVKWSDGKKTVVKCREEDDFCEDQGFAMALAKKIYGTHSEYMKYVRSAERQVDVNTSEKIVCFELLQADSA